MNLAKYSLDNTKIIYFFLAVLLIGGITSFGKLGKKEDAPFVIKSAVIMTRYPGAEPAEVERLITEPISREIQSMSGVYKIKSESMYGLSKITFELFTFRQFHPSEMGRTATQSAQYSAAAAQRCFHPDRLR